MDARDGIAVDLFGNDQILGGTAVFGDARRFVRVDDIGEIALLQSSFGTVMVI